MLKVEALEAIYRQIHLFNKKSYKNKENPNIREVSDEKERDTEKKTSEGEKVCTCACVREREVAVLVARLP